MTGSTPASELPVAVYPGSFDPVTRGHVEIAQRAARIFRRVIVAVGKHPHKPSFFTAAERCALIEESLEHVPNAVAGSFDGLVVDYCKSQGARVIVRGLRAIGDFEPEFQMGLANRDLAPDIETMFMLPLPEQQFVTSSLIREIASYGGEFERYVTPPVAAALRKRMAADR